MNTPPPGPDPRIAFFDHLAPRWDGQGPDPAATGRRLDGLAGRLGLRPGWRLLEAGCGTGQITDWLAAQVSPGRVTALDFAPGMLAAARARGVDADFVEADVCAAPPPGGPYDVAFCFNVFPHFRDPAAALRHLGAALTPGGQLIVLHLAGSGSINQFHASLSGPVNQDRLPAAAAWPGLLAATGFAAPQIDDREDLFLLRAWRR